MGYDMYWESGPTAEEQAAENAARAAFQEAVRIRDERWPRDAPREEWEESPEQKAVMAASDAIDAARPSYFRLNIWGMSICRQLMDEQGMLDVEASHGEFPTTEDFGIEEYPDSDDDFPPDSPEARFLAAHKEVIEGDAGSLIPAYKLGSNDNWLVTPEEIRRSLAAFEENGSVREVWWDDSKEQHSFTNPAERFVASIATAAVAAGVETDIEDAGLLRWWPEWIDWLRGAVDRGGFRVR